MLDKGLMIQRHKEQPAAALKGLLQSESGDGKIECVAATHAADQDGVGGDAMPLAPGLSIILAVGVIHNVRHGWNLAVEGLLGEPVRYAGIAMAVDVAESAGKYGVHP